MTDATAPIDIAQIRREAAAFAAPIVGRSLGQVATTFGPLLLALIGMYAAVTVSYGLTLAIAAVAAGFVVRVFIIQHDCGHGSFFRSRWSNMAMGMVCSLVTFAPYAMWRRQHAGHHRMWNNLDHRQSGADIYSTCSTVKEYQALSRWAKLRFRAVRHPLVYLGLLPPVVFLLLYRIPFDAPRAWARERRQVLATNLAIAAAFAGLSLLFGWRAVLMVQLPVAAIAAIYGVWLFSLQHRFEGVVWSRQDGWDPGHASVTGSSYLKLPRILQWFTGNIGFHHIHHLNARIPNYRLQSCFAAVHGLQQVQPLRLRDGLRAFRFVLWDEEQGRMIRLADLAARKPVPGIAG